MVAAAVPAAANSMTRRSRDSRHYVSSEQGAPTALKSVYVIPDDQECSDQVVGSHNASHDESGHPLINEVGELVITEPMPSMPLFFWNDPDGRRYRESYFEMYPGVWRHGDADAVR